jgi:hypothetical protein
MTKELHGYKANNRGLPITYWDAIELLKQQRIELIGWRGLCALLVLTIVFLCL